MVERYTKENFRKRIEANSHIFETIRVIWEIPVVLTSFGALDKMLLSKKVVYFAVLAKISSMLDIVFADRKEKRAPPICGSKWSEFLLFISKVC